MSVQMPDEFAYIYPAQFDAEDWLELSHEARIKVLYCTAQQARDTIELRLITDEIKYYMSIQSQIDHLILSSHVK